MNTRWILAVPKDIMLSASRPCLDELFMDLKPNWPKEASASKIAELNGVADRVILSDWADGSGIATLCSSKRCFVLSDCEGYEVELFNKPVAKALSQSDVLIEIHETAAGDVSRVLCERFAPTHATEIISVEPRRLADHRDFAHLGEDGERAIEEYRTNGQTWLWCTSRSFG
jgi:hypothetical protein